MVVVIKKKQKEEMAECEETLGVVQRSFKKLLDQRNETKAQLDLVISQRNALAAQNHALVDKLKRMSKDCDGAPRHQQPDEKEKVLLFSLDCDGQGRQQKVPPRHHHQQRPPPLEDRRKVMVFSLDCDERGRQQKVPSRQPCVTCGKGAEFQCKRCKKVYYCSSGCRSKHKHKHKRHCHKRQEY